MKRSKLVILVGLIIVLIGAVGYLGYLVQSGEDPLALLNLRASNDESFQDPLLAQSGNVSDLFQSPSPTVGFVSTSPTSTPSASLSPVVSVSPSTSPSPSVITPTVSPTITQTPTPSPTKVSTPSPTQVKQLPQSGITDQIDYAVFGGMAMILLALLL